ncbi:hypothetical protein JOF41_007349 [Saccharothrix coeruleofusca]|uniref:hypothetical protein n=1 Tax=Saccharothrix coeruleofusca TaxID=33919 RepID=UPI001AE429F1|nr:hypothetical protein [Saccharothrix coeruleofusca]MBP2341095.1 hypothetical protein [Saccharothrix coeruleofusca]
MTAQLDTTTSGEHLATAQTLAADTATQLTRTPDIDPELRALITAVLAVAHAVIAGIQQKDNA